MKKIAHVKAIAPLALLALVMLPFRGYTQQLSQNANAQYQRIAINQDAASRQQQWLDRMRARQEAHNKEEKLVQRAYLLLMRYNRGANAEMAARDRVQLDTQAGIQFEFRSMQTGPIEQVLDKPITDLISLPIGDTLLVIPEYYSYNSGPKHVRYKIRWSDDADLAEPEPNSTEPQSRESESTVRESLAKDPNLANVGKYTSYEVTVRLAGKERTYKAMALHYGSSQAVGATSIRFIDWVVGPIALGKALKESLPAVRAPWDTYVRSDTYRAIVQAIKRAQEEGRPLVREDSPVDFLPGDDVAPDPNRVQARGELTAAAACQGCAVAIIEETISPGDGTLPVRNPAKIQTGFAPVFEATLNPQNCPVTWSIRFGPGTILGANNTSLATVRGNSTGNVGLQGATNAGVPANIDVPVVNQRVVEVRVWIVRDSKGTGAATTATRVNSHISDTNLIWEQCGIHFQLVGGVQFIDNTTFLNPGTLAVRDQLRNTHTGTSGIEVYYVDSFPDHPNYTGETSNDGVIVNDGGNSRTLAHELGHAMGLGHSGNIDLHLMNDFFSNLIADIRLWECDALARFTSN